MTDSMLEYYSTPELQAVNWRKVCELKTRSTFAEMLRLFKARMSFSGLGIGIDILKPNTPLDMMIGHDLTTLTKRRRYIDIDTTDNDNSMANCLVCDGTKSDTQPLFTTIKDKRLRVTIMD